MLDGSLFRLCTKILQRTCNSVFSTINFSECNTLVAIDSEIQFCRDPDDYKDYKLD